MTRPAVTALISCVIGMVFSVIPLFITATSVLLIPITSQTGWSRGDVSLIIAAGQFSMAPAVFLVGRLIASQGVRRVIVPSTLLFAASLVAFAYAPSFEWALLAAVSVGVFGTGASQFAYLTVLPLWFERRLGLALGIAMLGIGLGVVLGPIAVEALARTHDWRAIYRIMAGLVICIALPNALVLLRVPQKGSRSVTTACPIVSSDFSLKQAIRTRQFWQLCISLFIAASVLTGLGVHLAGLMTDRGFKPAEVARIFSLFGGALLLARFTGGVLLDHIDARLVGGGFLFAACIGSALLASGVTGWLAIASIGLLGAAHGLDGDLLPYMARRYFGARSYSTIFGSLGFAFALGPPLGSIILGRGFDWFGSYTPLLWAITGAMLVATILLVAIGGAPPMAANMEGSDDRL